VAKGNPFQKVSSGQSLEIPAEAYNGFIDSVLDLKARQRSLKSGPGAFVPFGDIVRVQNQSDDDLDRFGVLGIEDALIRPVNNASEFASAPSIIGVLPESRHRGKFCVAVEPIQRYSVGLAVVAGLAPAVVQLLEPFDDDGNPEQFADVLPGEDGFLTGSGGSGARILWHEPWTDREEQEDPSLAYALIVIGGGAAPGGQFAVLVYIDGGSAGSSSTDCTYTYTVRTLGGKLLGTAMTPQKRRFSSVPYSETPDATPGLAYYRNDGTVVLFDANEVPDLLDCGGDTPVDSVIDGGVP
jgi:hypothetical protein